jgi:hypothetical protein
MAHTSQFCTFYLDKLLFGVELKGVQEVIRSLDITKVPLALGMVSGLMNLRGQIVTAVDLRRGCRNTSWRDSIRSRRLGRYRDVSELGRACWNCTWYTDDVRHSSDGNRSGSECIRNQ